MSRGGRNRTRVRREDPSLDALVEETFGAETATVPAKKEPVHRPFRGWKDDQENWLKASGNWGR